MPARIDVDASWQERLADGHARQWAPTATVAFVLVFNIAAWGLIAGGIFTAI
ncbi:MAG: hypothetical protein ACTSUD_04030 [Alphaproteobacteria bacterium]